MKTIYKVSRCETEHYHILIEARSEEEARNIAKTKEGDCWKSNQDFDAEVVWVEEAEDNEIVGRIIEKDERVFPCEECHGEMKQDGYVQPNGLTYYECDVCGRRQSFP